MDIRHFIQVVLILLSMCLFRQASTQYQQYAQVSPYAQPQYAQVSPYAQPQYAQVQNVKPNAAAANQHMQGRKPQNPYAHLNCVPRQKRKIFCMTCTCDAQGMREACTLTTCGL